MKQTSKFKKFIILLLIYLFGLYFISYLNQYIDFTTGKWLSQLPEVLEKAYFLTKPLKVKLPGISTLGVYTAIFIVSVLSYFNNKDEQKRLRPGKEKGSSKWNSDLNSYNKQFTSPLGKKTNDGEDNMILSKDVYLSSNAKAIRRNSNILIIGGSGTGKTFGFIKPNVAQMNCSYVVTDPKGEVLACTGKFLEENGYEVKVFNLIEMSKSSHYNPFHYIRNQDGIAMLINTLIKNTTPSGASKGDPFWEKSETALLQAIFNFMYSELDESERNFRNVVKILQAAKDVDETGKTILDYLMESLPEDHIARLNYNNFKFAAGNTVSSILISCAVRLGQFLIPSIANLTNTDDIDLVTIGDKKTALFILIPDSDTTNNFIAAIMYAQLFETLYFRADNFYLKEGKKLPIATRFLLDEFANIGEIPDFDKKLSTMRSRGISCSIVIQTLDQLKTMYKDAWATLVDNCDSLLFLGGQGGSTTSDYISKRLGKETIITQNRSRSYGKNGSYSVSKNVDGRELLTSAEVGTIPNDKCIVFVRGVDPFFSNKYKFTDHKMYKESGDSNVSYIFDLQKYADKLKTNKQTINYENSKIETYSMEETTEKPKEETEEVLSIDLENTEDEIIEEDTYIKKTEQGIETFKETTLEETLKNFDIQTIKDMEDVFIPEDIVCDDYGEPEEQKEWNDIIDNTTESNTQETMDIPDVNINEEDLYSDDEFN